LKVLSATTKKENKKSPFTRRNSRIRSRCGNNRSFRGRWSELVNKRRPMGEETRRRRH